MDRLNSILQHLNLVPSPSTAAAAVSSSSSSSDKAYQFDTADLRRFLDGKEWETKDAWRDVIQNTPSLTLLDDPTISYSLQRERSISYLHHLSQVGLIRIEDQKENVAKFYSGFEVLGYFDMNIYLRFFIQHLLFGGSILKLGTERHKRLIPEINRAELIGGYAMTEIGHGSNVRGIETTATFDKQSQEFVIHTPTDSAKKIWIASTACYGRYVCVFANTIVEGKNHGVNAFLVPIRGEDLNISEGVHIIDCGSKLGMNGMDNGILTFTNKRVPRENLLNRFVDVTPEGKVVSNFKRETDRFRATTESLVGERLTPCAGPGKLGIAIAIRYATWRRQFAPPGEPEVPILNYITHKRRLLQPMACLIANDFLMHYLWDRVSTARTPADSEEIYILSAGAKSYSGWLVNSALQFATECCGAQGFRSTNRFAVMRADCASMLTGAGDNTVIVQQISKYILTLYMRQVREMTSKDKIHFFGPLAHFNRQPKQTARFDTLQGQQELLQWRERHLYELLTTSITNKAAEGMSRFDAWNASLPLALGLASSWFDRVTHDVFTKAVQQAPDNLKGILSDLCTLFCLSTDEFPANSLNKGYKPPLFQTLEAHDFLDDVLNRVAPYSEQIVDSWGIPEKCFPQRDLLGGLN